MDILLTNDDGVLAEGLGVLRRALEPLGNVWVVAPEREQSGASHALTLHRPLRVRRLEERLFSVDGTPTDCVLIACKGIPELRERPIRIVVSGINHGANLSEDVIYSGTVAAAVEGRLLGISAIAISQDDWQPGGFEEAGRVAAELAGRVLQNDPGHPMLLNANLPNRGGAPILGYRMTRLGKRAYAGRVVQKTDPRGRPYYWIGEEEAAFSPQPGTDFQAVREGYVSITPLDLDLTDHGAIPLLSALALPAAEEGIGGLCGGRE